MFWVWLVLVWGLGSASHFFYQWSGKNKWAGLLFANNESVWERSKLGFWPLCIALTAQGIGQGAAWESVCCAAACATLCCIALTMGMFYTYTGALGIWSVLWADILLFLLAAAGGLAAGWNVLKAEAGHWMGVAGALLLAAEVACLIRWSVRPPKLPLFTDYSVGKKREPAGEKAPLGKGKN